MMILALDIFSDDGNSSKDVDYIRRTCDEEDDEDNEEELIMMRKRKNYVKFPNRTNWTGRPYY